jgi:hypothetical protein
MAKFNHEMPNVRLGILETNSLLDLVLKTTNQYNDVFEELEIQQESIRRSQDSFENRLNDIEAMLIKIRKLETEASANQGKLIQ